MSESKDRQNVIIVGAGAGGARAAHMLTRKLDFKRFNLIVINPRPSCILTPSTARLVVSDRDNLRDRLFVNIEDILKGKGRFVQGKATKVEPAKERGGIVVVDNGERIGYKVLILAPGVSWDAPFGFPEDFNKLDSYLKTSRDAFEKAEDFVLVGAGAVGCELAGELRDVWPNKKIIIVHGDTLPLNKTYPDKFRKAVQKNIESRNIEFLFEEYVDDIQGLEEQVNEIRTRSGKVIKCNLAISTRGQRFNTELFKESFGQDLLTERGFVKVEPTLQLPGQQDIFAIGDVIDWNEQKQWVKAQAHAEVVIPNVIALLHDQLDKLKTYKGTVEYLALTNGSNAGVMFVDALGGIVVGNMLTRLIKSKSLLVAMQRGTLGVV